MKWNSGSNSHFTLPSIPLPPFSASNHVLFISEQVWCQRSAKFLLCFWLKIFQRLWRRLCAMLSAWRRCLKYISIFDRLNSLDCSSSGESHLNYNAQKNGINSTFSLSVSEPGHYMQSEGAAFQRRPGVLCFAFSQGHWSKVDWQVRDLQLWE